MTTTTNLARLTPERFGMSRHEQNRFSWQQSRLLSNSTLAMGLTGVAGALVCLIVPGVITGVQLLVSGLLLLALAAAHVLLSIRRSPPLTFAVCVIAITASATIMVGESEPGDESVAVAVVLIVSWGVGSLAPLLVSSWGGILSLIVAYTGCILCLLTLDVSPATRVLAVAYVVTTWGVSAAFGIWLDRCFLSISMKVAAIGEAYRVERIASSVETKRLRDARLLHDTVLATLSMMAHGGEGVPGHSLREQAGADAELLRRLRLGETTHVDTPTAYAPNTNDARLPQYGDFAAIVDRFTSLGLNISWHGVTELALTASRTVTLQLAVTECLENVRRHAGTHDVHVTASDDGVTVRIVVTDTGRGFDPADVPSGELGFRGSVIGRLAEVGGEARVFSRPNAGTTIVLEMPK